MKVQMIDYNHLEILPESVAEHQYLMRFRDARIEVEGPAPFGFNANTLKLIIPEVEKDTVV